MYSTAIRIRPLFLVVAALTLSGLGACTDTVYRDRPPFNTPPDAASGFLGYYTASTQQTTCGNCHVGQQADWSQTKHASAWNGLQSSGFAQPFCEGCHTVNSRGNQPLATVGNDSVQTEVYHDVQCESCHGPGFNHVTNPSIDSTRPIASINIDTAIAIANNSCGACHTDNSTAKHHNYLKEWLSSRHGKLNAYPAGNASCAGCHEGKAAITRFAGNRSYKESGSSTLLPQNCVVCHDPHGTAKDANGNVLPGQLRFAIDTPDPTQNLCLQCHNRVDKVDPTPTNLRGPHGSQGPVLFGQAGYFPPGASFDTTIIYTSHGSTANPRLCAGCHVNKLAGVDAAGNAITFSGHSFHPLPCLQQKSPSEVVDTTFTNTCAYDAPSRSWVACTGCHTETVAQQLFTNFRNEVDSLTRTLWINTTKCGPPGTCIEVVDTFPADSGYLAKIKLAFPGDLDYTGANKNLLTGAKGATFNVQMLGEGYADHPDGSKGVHNPFLYRALLQASVADMLAQYPGTVPAPPAPVLAAIQNAVRSGQLRLAPATEKVVMNADAARTTTQVSSHR